MRVLPLVLLAALPAWSQLAPGPVNDFILKRNASAPQIERISYGTKARTERESALASAAQGGILDAELVTVWKRIVELADLVDSGDLSLEAAQQARKSMINTWVDSAVDKLKQQEVQQRRGVMAEEQAQMARQREEEAAKSRAFIDLGLGILRANNPPPSPVIQCNTSYNRGTAYTTCR